MPKKTAKVFVTPYYVFVNRGRHLAHVHYANCGECNDGIGKRGVIRNQNGWWSEPLPRWDDALAYAERHMPNDASACKHCAPDGPLDLSPADR